MDGVRLLIKVANGLHCAGQTTSAEACVSGGCSALVTCNNDAGMLPMKEYFEPPLPPPSLSCLLHFLSPLPSHLSLAFSLLHLEFYIPQFPRCRLPFFLLFCLLSTFFLRFFSTLHVRACNTHHHHHTHTHHLTWNCAFPNCQCTAPPPPSSFTPPC